MSPAGPGGPSLPTRKSGDSNGWAEHPGSSSGPSSGFPRLLSARETAQGPDPHPRPGQPCKGKTQEPGAQGGPLPSLPSPCKAPDLHLLPMASGAASQPPHTQPLSIGSSRPTRSLSSAWCPSCWDAGRSSTGFCPHSRARSALVGRTNAGRILSSAGPPPRHGPKGGRTSLGWASGFTGLPERRVWAFGAVFPVLTRRAVYYRYLFHFYFQK